MRPLAGTKAPVIPWNGLQLPSKTASGTWGTGASDAMLERVTYIDSGWNHETGKMELKEGERKKGFSCRIERKLIDPVTRRVLVLARTEAPEIPLTTLQSSSGKLWDCVPHMGNRNVSGRHRGEP